MHEKLFLVTILLAIAELGVSLFWVRKPWTLAPPIFRSTRRVIPGAARLPPATEIQTAFPAGMLPQLVFRQFDDNTVAFRESYLPRFFAFNYTPLMRGIIRFNRMNGSIEVTGYGYWWTITFVVLFTSTFLDAGAPEIPRDSGFNAVLLAFFGVLLASLYLVQALRFWGVAKEAAEIMDADVRHG